jgi:hypothetical protein
MESRKIFRGTKGEVLGVTEFESGTLIFSRTADLRVPPRVATDSGNLSSFFLNSPGTSSDGIRLSSEGRFRSHGST